MINIDGKNSHLILKGNDINADWSSDGKWIVYEVGAQIYKAPVINDVVDILKIKQLTFEGRNFFPAWSPDGKWIAYDSNKDSPNGMNFIWKMRSDGSGKIRLAYEPKKGEIREPNWSPDGNSIVHIRYSADFNTDASEICIMDQNGNKLKRLTFNDVMENNPKYSADGTKIVFWLSGVLWIMDSDGNNLKKLINNGNQPCWSPDGKKIAYISWTDKGYSPQNNGTLWIMDADGNNKRQLTYGPKQN